MPRTQWNDAEDAALHGLPWVAQLLYLRAIRPYMDYATGIVGIKRGISLKSLSEMLHVEPMQGRKDAGDPSQKAIRHALDLLERAGLIARLSADRQLIFKLPLADADSSASEKRGRFGADLGQTNQGRPNACDNKDLGDMWGRFGADPEPEKRGTPPVSGNPEEEKESEANASPCRGAGSRFAEFWDAWPSGHRKRDRHKAEQSWKRHRLDRMADLIIADVQRRATDDQQWQRGYAPMPTTYLNGRRWEDEFAAPPETAQPNGKKPAGFSLAERNQAAIDTWLGNDNATPAGRVIEGDFRRASN